MIDPNDGCAQEQDAGHLLEDEFERELRSSLRPHPAPEEFAVRTLRRRQLAAVSGTDFRDLRSPKRPRHSRFQVSQPWLRWGAAACLLLTVVVGGLMQRAYERHEAGERARQQVMLALRITSATLRNVRNKVESPRLSGTTESEPQASQNP